MHHFHKKLPYQKPVLRQTKWWVQNGSIAKKQSRVLPVITLFFWKFCFSLRTSYKSWFNVPMTQMPIFEVFASAGVLLEGAFSLWVPLTAMLIC